ncbi:DNA cytosine methyltransferase [soil metagenome]
MRIVGTFSGIGGLELPFHERGHEPMLLCDNWAPSQQVLADRFGGVDIVGDIHELAETGLPSGVELLTVGFPCTDLSQAGRKAGIGGSESGLVRQVFRILETHPSVSWLVLENVRNMLVLDGGQAMRFLTESLNALGFRWAYRLVDSRFTGVPQRRHRVILVATRGLADDPRRVLFADEAGEPDHADGAHLRPDAFGFYWTEGLRGLGWAVDAVPPLKGGSSVGIPSPPGIWVPGAPLGRRIIVPDIEHAELLQGFARGWTKAAELGGRNSPRWKLVGNAVTADVGRWLVSRLEVPGDPVVENSPTNPVGRRWPPAAWGDSGGSWTVDASTWPLRGDYQHLLDIVDVDEAAPLSARGAAGFLSRLVRSSLNRPVEFDRDMREHIGALAVQPSLIG